MNESQIFTDKLEQYNKAIMDSNYDKLRMLNIRSAYERFYTTLIYLIYTNKTVRKNKHIQILKSREEYLDNILEINKDDDVE